MTEERWTEQTEQLSDVEALMADIDAVMGRLESIKPASDSEARIIAAIGELVLVVARLLPEEA